MATKKKFIKNLSEVKKSAANDLMNAGIRVGACAGTAVLLNGKLGEKIPNNIKKWRGPLVMGIGLLGDVFLTNDKLKAACQGITCYGGMESIADIAFKGDGSKMGLAPRKDIKGIENTEKSFDWDALTEQAKREAEMSGIENPNPFIDTAVDVLGEDKRESLEGWLAQVLKWKNINPNDHKANILHAVWQMYASGKSISKKDFDDVAAAIKASDEEVSGIAEKASNNKIELD